MYIRSTTIKTKKSGGSYHTFRLVESERVNGKVKQTTLINLGKYFNVPKEHWRDLAQRIDQIAHQQASLFTVELTVELEKMAQRYAAQIIHAETQESSPDQFDSIDLDSIELVRPRQIGVEQLALHAVKQLSLIEKLQSLGFNQHQLAASLGNIIARMAAPASETATHRWLQNTSGLGELIDYDFEGMGHDRLYQASDLLWKHRDEIQDHLYAQEKSLFHLEETITLYDLTNTFFEGTAASNPMAKRGRSKEKRTDCPLVTLGLVLDGSGFPRKSQIFPGNASEASTLEKMLCDLNGRAGSTVILDAGIASQENVNYLVEHGYTYIVVSRKRHREFSEETAVLVKDAPGNKVKVQRIESSDPNEVELYCHSELREQKEEAIQNSFSTRYEVALNHVHEGLSKKGSVKRYQKVLERLGRLKEKYARAAQHYTVEVTADDEKEKAIAVEWTRTEKMGTQATHPGVYCLRTNCSDWDDEKLWRIDTMLTDLEAVFRSLKSELGLRPIYHQKEARVGGHILITLIAYHLVQTLCYPLQSQGVNHSWKRLRQTMRTQQRVTITMQHQNGKTIHIRKATKAEPEQSIIYQLLGVPNNPGGIQRTIL